jgi:hypothetical protein
MDQRIEPPTASDIDRIAKQLIHAESIVIDIAGRAFDGSRADLSAIQSVLDVGAVERDATYTLQSLGMAFGKVFFEQHRGFDWWMVEDEYGRDPAIRFGQTLLLAFPQMMIGQTLLLAFPQMMISKRIEDDEHVDVEDLFELLSRRLVELSEEQRSET